MGKHFLYSTNVYLKYWIQKNYANDVHYVWCSEEFDSRHLGTYALGAPVAPTSNPAEIYRDLDTAVKRGDLHCTKIKDQRALFNKRALVWKRSGIITPAQHADLLYQIKIADLRMWRPVIYIIPRALVEPTGRMQAVAAHQRAHPMGPEFQVTDLKGDEFDLIEL